MKHSDMPYQELRRAEEALASMRSSANLEAFEESWKEFLRRIERVWTKLIAHFGKSPKWSGWCSRYEHLRRTDQLLAYLVNARGAEEHTINEIVERELGGIGINAAVGDSLHIERLEFRGNNIHIQSAQPIKLNSVPAKIRLLPVVNRGRTYAVPSKHLGAPVDPENVPAVADAAMTFYRDALQKAEAFFVK